MKQEAEPHRVRLTESRIAVGAAPPLIPSLASSLRLWAEMVKFSHSVFALPFALLAAFLAGRHLEGRTWPHGGQLALIVLCMVAARSVSMTFNRIVDARIDAQNPRTALRPLPTGQIGFLTAWIMLALFTITFGLACLGFYVWYENGWPMLLSGPVLLYLCGYSFTKRFTNWTHFCLGGGIAFSPVAAWIAIHPSSLGISALCLFTSVTSWIAGFDILYACQDIEIDRRHGLHSLPAWLGPRKAFWIARGCHLLVVCGLTALGLSERLGLWYALGVALTALLLIVEHCLVRPGDYCRINVAFFTINGIVSLLLAASGIIDIAVRA